MARPNLSYLKNTVLVVVGVPCGLLTGLTGMTNSYLVAPLLSWLIGLRDARLIGSALAVASFSSLTGILAYAQQGVLDWSLIVVVGLGFLVGAAFGQRAGSVPAARVGGAVLGIALGAAMIVVAHLSAPWHALAAGAFRSAWWPAAALVLGIATGLAGRVLDLAGLLIVPALYYVAGASMLAAQACALAILLVNSIPAAITYAQRSLTEVRSAVWMSFGALLGALGGSQATAAHHQDHQMTIIYAIAMICLIVIRQLSNPTSAPPAGTAQ